MSKKIIHKFDNIHVVDGEVKLDIKLDRFTDQYNKAQYTLDSMVFTSMVPYMPHNTGVFIDTTQAMSQAIAGSGKVVAAAPPMGRFLYEGKTMVDAETGSAWARKGAKKVLVSQYGGKTKAKENLTYSRAEAKPQWFEVAKEKHGDKWVEAVKKIAGGGTK